MKGAKGAALRRAKKSPRATRTTDSTELPRSRYLFFGGKGGVGKTTTAAATALSLLDDSSGAERILLFSTDPAHSLSDSLEVGVGDRPAEVARRGDSLLIAHEMDAAAALEKFKTKHRPTLAEIADRGTLLDESDINELLNLSLPGMDEVMALFELSELDREGEYARVVVDTAPSGHTSRLLRLPEVFSRMVAALDRMADKHRYIMAQFARGGRVRADEVDAFLLDLSERVARVRKMLYDPALTSFVLVTIPEEMSVEETSRYFELLRKEGVPVTDLVVNRVETGHGGCPYCRARKEGQSHSLERIAEEFAPLRLHRVPLMPTEVRGLWNLRLFARAVWSGDEGVAAEVRSRMAEGVRRKALKAGGRSPALETEAELTTAPPLPDADCLLPANSRLLLFGGKGGVGKTTAAAASALALADADARARVLVFSTDPAHSLSDSFGEPVGEFRRGVSGRANLDAMEIDPVARFEELKGRYSAWVDELFGSLSAGSRWEIQFDREAMRELVSLSPPGIDEMAALSAVSDLLDKGGYTTIVLDTAPTGHLVRFLELPGVALSWVRTFIKLLLKYQSVIRPGGVAEELVALSKSIKRVMALLTEARACQFIGVAAPERMSFEESVRLAGALKRLGVPARGLLVNGVVPETAAAGCDFCRERRRAQEAVIEEFRREFAEECALFYAPQQPYDVRGPARLLEHFGCWRPLAKEHAAAEGGKRRQRGSTPKAGRARKRATN